MSDILIVYYSFTGNSKNIVLKIMKNYFQIQISKENLIYNSHQRQEKEMKC